MKLPKSMTICGVRYRIEARNHLSDGGSCQWGHIDYGERTLRFGTRTDAGRIRGDCDLLATVIHEIIHGTLEHCPAAYKLIVEDGEEALVKTLASALADTLLRSGMIRQ